MKKCLSIILILAMLFSVGACGSKETAEHVIQLIDAIGEVTQESGDAIEKAQLAYDSLSKEEKKNVSNHIELLRATTRYKGLVLLCEVQELKQAGKVEEAQIKIEAEKNKDNEAYWEFLRLGGMDEEIKISVPSADECSREILAALKEGNFEFVIQPPTDYQWSMGTQDQPLQKYTHAYITYCSFFNNMGGNTAYKCGDTFKITTKEQGSPLTATEVTEMTALSYEVANKMAQELISKRTGDISEYQIAEETVKYIKNFYSKCSQVKLSGRKGLTQIETDHVYKVLVEKQHGNVIPALNMVLEAQGIEAYGLMMTDRGCHFMVSLASLDEKLYICDPFEGKIINFNEIPSGWNLSAIYSNIDLISSIMGITLSEENLGADLSVLGKNDLIESLDGDIRLYVDYISTDENGDETYCIKAQGTNTGKFSKYKVLLGLASCIVIRESISYEDLRAGFTVTIDKSTKASINILYEGLGFFAKGIK